MNKKSFKFEDVDITTIVLVVIIILILYFVFSDDRPENDPKVFDLNMGLDLGENKEFSLDGRASMDYDSIDVGGKLELDNEDKIYGDASINYNNLDGDGLSLGTSGKVGLNDFKLGGRTGAYVDDKGLGASATVNLDDDYYHVKGKLEYDDRYGAQLDAIGYDSSTGQLDKIGFETGYNTVADDFYFNIEGFQNPESGLDLSGDKKYLVYFYADWCGFCKKFKPIWDELKEHYKKKDVSNFELKEFESANKEMMEKYKIDGYPTLKLISKEGVVDYNEERIMKNIISWVTQN